MAEVPGRKLQPGGLIREDLDMIRLFQHKKGSMPKKDSNRAAVHDRENGLENGLEPCINSVTRYGQSLF